MMRTKIFTGSFLVSLLILMCILLVRPDSTTLAATVLTTTSSSTRTTATPPSSKKEAIVLNSRNFEENISDGSVWLVEFYAPWCSHCVRFSSSYEEVAKAVHAQNNDEPTASSTKVSSKKRKNKKSRAVKVAKVNGDSESAVAGRFGVTGFPAFYVVDGWSVYEFNEDRSVPSLVAFALGGYKDTKPISFWMSPMGPIGQVQGQFLRLAMFGVTKFEGMSRTYGPMLAGIILCGGFVFTLMISMVVLALAITPKTKSD